MKSSYRVVAVVSGKSEAVVLRGLISDTQYQVTVTAIWSGRKYRSRPIQFRTLGEIDDETRMQKRDRFNSSNQILYSIFQFFSGVTTYIATARLSNGWKRRQRPSTTNRSTLQRCESFNECNNTFTSNGEFELHEMQHSSTSTMRVRERESEKAPVNQLDICQPVSLCTQMRIGRVQMGFET